VPVPMSAMYLFVYVRDIDRARAFYEDSLGLNVVEMDERSVKYDAGDIILALNKADDFGIRVDRQRGSSLIVFHVTDLDQACAALAARGVVVDSPERYEIGATATCYDPDGHCITLYEPSKEALGWPSGVKYQSIVDAHPYEAENRGALASDGFHRRILGPLVYCFLFVRDTAMSAAFYEDKLGLRVLEKDEGEGVTKYDVGTMILATHPLEDYSPDLTGIDRDHSLSIAFRVENISIAAELLSSRHVDIDTPHSESIVGQTSFFRDPDAHRFYLYQLSDAAHGWPSGTTGEALLAELGGPPSH
jgi:catechol 2,3-dioxygenase-like lactoylglutathione lyase family enzyme